MLRKAARGIHSLSKARRAKGPRLSLSLEVTLVGGQVALVGRLIRFVTACRCPRATSEVQERAHYKTLFRCAGTRKQNTKFKVEDTKYQKQNTNYKIQITKHSGDVQAHAYCLKAYFEKHRVPNIYN